MELSAEIKEAFPSEDPQYYFSPFITIHGKKIGASGCLYHGLNNLKRPLRKLGLLGADNSNDQEESDSKYLFTYIYKSNRHFIN